MQIGLIIYDFNYESINAVTHINEKAFLQNHFNLSNGHYMFP